MSGRFLDGVSELVIAFRDGRVLWAGVLRNTSLIKMRLTILRNFNSGILSRDTRRVKMILRCLLLLVIFILLVNDSIKLRTKEICLKEKMYSYLCYFMIVFVTFYMMGVLGSGYHFVDDHEFVRYNKSLVSNGLIHTLCSAVKNDMLIRFRFTYIIIRVFESYLFPNYMVLHILQTFLVVQSLYLSYVLARKCGSSRWLSVVFSLVIYIGPQAEVWWRLGPQENWGVLFFMMTLLSIIRYMNTKRSGDFFLAVVFVFFLGGIKESFLVLLPALPLFMLWYSMRTDGGNITWIPVKKLVLEYKYFIGWIGVVFCLDISFILCVVGTNKIGYAGIDSQFDLSNYIVMPIPSTAQKQSKLAWRVAEYVSSYIKRRYEKTQNHTV